MADIGDAWRLVWEAETEAGETAVWRMHCAKKQVGFISSVHGAMEDFWSHIALAAFNPVNSSTLKLTRILEWDPVQMQYFQLSANVAVGLTQTGSQLPPQLAMVVSQRANAPLGARRQSYQNRSYLGPLNQAAVLSTARFSGGYMTNALDGVVALQGDLDVIANDPGVTFDTGLCVVSEKLQIATETVEVWVDNVPDTQRSRRKSIVPQKQSVLL